MVIPLDQSFYALSEIKIEKIEEDLLSGIPFDYQRGVSDFFMDRFLVNESVLIPRPETELLVEMVLNNHKAKNLSIADIGTGSGCIGLSLLKANETWKGVLSDISPKALEVAKLNANNLRLSHQTEFILSDRFENIKSEFDLIISNPPYIKSSSHRHLVQTSVNDFEPHSALYLEDEEYKGWFEQFFREIYKHLKEGGAFYMEGHELELEDQASQLLDIKFKSLEVLKDLSGRPRFLSVKK